MYGVRKWLSESSSVSFMRLFLLQCCGAVLFWTCLSRREGHRAGILRRVGLQQPWLFFGDSCFYMSCTKCFFLENLAQNHHKQLFAVDSLGAVSKLPVCSASLETQVTLIWSETEHFYRKWTWDVAQSIAVALLICTPYESPPGYTEVLFTFMLTRQFSLGSLHD